MGNTASKSPTSPNPGQFLGHHRVPHEIQAMIAYWLCPHCSAGDNAILATEEARKRQCDLGSLAATSKYLNVVANEHRFHSFVNQYDPHYSRSSRYTCHFDALIAKAERFQNKALPELLERLIQYGRLRQDLHYLSLRDTTMAYKAGVTKRRLRLFIAASPDHGIPVPDFVPGLLDLPEYTHQSVLAVLDLGFWLNGELWLIDSVYGPWRSSDFDAWILKLLLFGLAPRLKKLLIDPDLARDVFYSEGPPATKLPSVVTFVLSEGERGIFHAPPNFRTEVLLLSFPNLRTFQNRDITLTANPVRRDPAQSSPLFPNLRRLLLASEQPDRLEHVTQILPEFPQLEELHYHRRQGLLWSDDDDFCNAEVFNGVHQSLRKLTYSSTLVVQYPHPDHYGINILCYEEPRFSDVPHFGAFAMLEDLTIDQALLGRMSTIRDRFVSPVGPYFPDLADKLPQSLRCLTLHFVYDWPQLASQLVSVALAKDRGQFPHLRDIYVVLVVSGTLTYDYAWYPHIPLLRREELTHTTGQMMEEAGIDLWTRSAAIGPPPGEMEDYPREPVPAGTPINFVVRRMSFREP